MFLVAFYILPSFFNNVSFFTSLGAECVYLASYAFSFFLYDLMDDDGNDDGVSAASTATTTATRGSSPLGLGVALSLHHFTLLLVVVDVVVVVSAPPANVAASVSS